MSVADRVHFGMMSIVHETLYGLFRDPYRALEAAGLERGNTVLEIGCGPGFFTIPAARVVGAEGCVYALDISPLAIERVQQKVEAEGVSNVRTVLADATRTGLPGQSFELAFLFGFAHHRGSLDGILTETHRLLRPGGILSVEGMPWLSSELFYPVGRQGRISRFRKAG
jgi:ubiquinone/menaquinone biosynthesis C-methylase UbiE